MPDIIVFAGEAAAPEGEADGYVERRARLFRVGEYPDKDFSLTPEEMALAAAEFSPVPVGLEHHPTLLDGKLGELAAVEVDEDGQTLRGRVRLPAWLSHVLGSFPVPVSCAWDRLTKRLVGLGLVRTPRISDAALLAAFAGSEGVHWVTINGHPVAIHDKAVGREHIAHAPQQHGVSEAAAQNLHEAHAAGKIHTDAHLYKSIAYAKELQAKGMSESLAYREAVSRHGEDDPGRTLAALARREGADPAHRRRLSGLAAAMAEKAGLEREDARSIGERVAERMVGGSHEALLAGTKVHVRREIDAMGQEKAHQVASAPPPTEPVLPERQTKKAVGSYRDQRWQMMRQWHDAQRARLQPVEEHLAKWHGMMERVPEAAALEA